MEPVFVALISFVLICILALWAWGRRSRDSGLKPLSRSRAEIGEWSISYHQSGRGPDLVLLHGIGANLQCWRSLVPLLSFHFRVLAVDLPGFGQSSKIDGLSYGLDAQVDRLHSLMRHLDIGQAYWVGNSMGANLALWYAHRFPQEVLGAALIAPATSARLVPIRLDLLTWIAGPSSWFLTRPLIKWAHGRTVSKRLLVDIHRVEETLFTYYRRPEAVRSFLAATSAIRDSRLQAALRELRAKMLILWGTGDRLVPHKVISSLQSAVPGAELHIHSGGGHHLQEDDPDWVSEKIHTFFLRSPTKDH